VQLVCDALAASSAAQLQEKHLDLKIDLAPNARSLQGDERLLTLTLKNLLDNAIKFTHKGGITIRSYRTTPNGEGAPATAEAAAAPQPQEFVIEVSDTGIGIPPEDQERVFERFYTVNRSRGGADRGTGLGLSIVKHAVNAMHGTVELTSEPGKGTTIRCAYPLERV
jgi:signal transduction histidine kinase